MALAVLLAMLMLGAVWYYAYQHTRMMPSTVVVRTPFGPAVAPIPEQQTGQSHLPLHVFDLPGNQRPPGGRLPASRFATTSPTNQQAPIVAPSATQPASGDADSTEPPVAIDSAWDQVQAARFRTAKPGQAIIQYDEYRRLHPGQFAGQLDRYIDDAVDLLWWQRIVQLCRERDRLTGDIKQHDQDLTAQTAGSFHETLVQEKKDLEAQRAQVFKTLTREIGYKVQQPPDLENPAELKELAKSRDPAKYADFKKRVLSYVRDHHGEVWWQGPG